MYSCGWQGCWDSGFVVACVWLLMVVVIVGRIQGGLVVFIVWCLLL